MKKGKLVITLVLVAICLLQMVGCGSNTTPESKGTEASTGAPAATTGKSEPVAVKWYFPADSQDYTDDVFEKASEYLLKKINANVEFINMGFGEYDQKIQVINAAREPYEIVFTSSWLNNYNQNINRGGLMPIDDLILEYAPKTYAAIPADYWDGARVGGKLYGVINQQILARMPCLLVPQSHLKLGIDFTAIKSFDDFEGYLKTLYDATGSYSYLGNTWQSLSLMYGIEEIIGENVVGGINIYNKDDVKVFNQYESAEFVNMITKRREWFQKGLTQPSLELLDQKAFIEENGQDTVFPMLMLYATYKPGLEAEYEAATTVKIADIVMRKPGVVSTSSVTATLTGISATAVNPEKAMEVLELVNTDKHLFNLLCFGIEGVNFTLNADGLMKPNPDSPYSVPNWSVGNVFNSYIYEGSDPEVWNQTNQVNQEGISSPVIGFVPDLEPIKTQVSNCSAIAQEYVNTLALGLADINTVYPEFINKLKAAGSEEIVTELQRQVDEFLKTK